MLDINTISTYIIVCLTGKIDTMRVNVAQLLKEAVGSERIYKLEELIDERDSVPINGMLTLIHTNRGILGKGTVSTYVEGTCNRCLNSIEIPLEFDFTEEFFPLIDINSGKPVNKEANGFTIDNNNILDLTEVIRQYTVLKTPMKQLCKPNCAGICPSCGKDLNAGDCGCTRPLQDKRWDKLVNLGKE